MTDAPNTDVRTDTEPNGHDPEPTADRTDDASQQPGTTRRRVLQGIGALGLTAATTPDLASAASSSGNAPARTDAVVRRRGEFIDAVEGDANVVWIDSDAEIDLTGYSGIELEDITLLSGRGIDGPGAHIICNSYPSRLFRTTGRVRIAGLRIEGPNPKQFEWPGYSSGKISAAIGVRDEAVIENCELSGWTHTSIAVGSIDTDGRVQVRDCDIHHCQMGGLGYGINIYEGNAWIEGCTFDYTRHAIAGGGAGAAANCSYTAVRNFHGPHTVSHAFDMHGDDDWVAGDRIVIRENTFAVDDDNAVKIRGVPKNGCRVEQNEFAHKSKPKAPGDSDSAVQQIHYGRADPFADIHLWGNAYGNTRSNWTGAPDDVISRYYSVVG